MNYSNFGISLINLTEQDLELVRGWRNDPLVVRNHAYREFITPEMQQQWFKSIRNIHHAYFVILCQGNKVGVINAKGIDWERMECESGIFIPDPAVYHTMVPAMVSIMTSDLFFRIFRWKRVVARTLRTNPSVMRYNRSLGYVLCEGQEGAGNPLYELTPGAFYRKAGKWLEALPALTGEANAPVILIEPSDEEDPVVMKFEKSLLQGNPLLKSQVETGEGRRYLF